MMTILANANVLINGELTPSDILVEDGVISAFSEHGRFSGSVSADTLVIDCKNKYIFPGFSDVHVHFREPGFFYKETIKTGSEAAAAGGYTDVCTMPNLKPVPDSAENLKEQTDIIKKDAVIRVHPYGSLSKGEAGGEASDIEGMEAAEFAPVAYSDDGVGLVSDELMEKALKICAKYGKIIAAHCEYKNLMQGKAVNEGPAAKALGIEGISNISEWKMVERDLKLLEKVGGRYHVCHVSTKESVELIREAKKKGLDVTCETGPHYLIFNDEDVAAAIINDKNMASTDAGNVNENGVMSAPGTAAGSDNKDSAALALDNEKMSPAMKPKYGIGRMKMNPPIRSEEDRKALVEGLLDGTIDMIATDHAPHALEEKMLGMIDGPMGVTGLECAFPVMYTYMVKKGIISLEKLIELMSTAPGKRFGFDNEIRIGAKANLSVFDLEEEYVINPDEFKTMGRFTPFDGFKVQGKCMMTMCDGSIVYRSGKF